MTLEKCASFLWKRKILEGGWGWVFFLSGGKDWKHVRHFEPGASPGLRRGCEVVLFDGMARLSWK